MDVVFRIIFLLLTFLIGFAGFANLGLPIFYGLPRAISAYRSRKVKTRLITAYLFAFALWLVLLTIIISILYWVFSLFVDRIVTVGIVGLAIGFLFGAFNSLTTSGKDSIRTDFVEAMSKHISDDEAENNKSTIAALIASQLISYSTANENDAVDKAHTLVKLAGTFPELLFDDSLIANAVFSQGGNADVIEIWHMIREGILAKAEQSN